MLKILKNLKQSFVYVILIILLLCVQAKIDLELPDYTSKIVNIGIQQGGIQSLAPEVIGKSTMENLLFVIDKDEEILNYYELNSENLSEEGNKKIKEYFGKDKEVEKNTIYVQKRLENKEKEELENKIKNPLMALSSIQLEQMQLSEDALNNFLSEVHKQIEQMPDTILDQMVIAKIKAEYQAIGVDLDSLQNRYILMAGIQMLGVALISMVAAISIMFLSAKVAAKLGKTLRNKIFKKVLSFSNKEFTEFQTASLITRSTNDIQQIQMLIGMLFRVLIYAPIVGIGGFLKVLTKSNNSMAWIIGVAILAILFIVGTLFVIAMPKFKKLQDLIDKLNLVAREILTGLPVIRAFNKEKYEEERFEKANHELMKTNIFVNRAMSMMMPMLMFIMNSIMLLIIWFGGKNVDQGIMQVGDMMAFIQYTMQIIMSFLMISMMSIMLPRASVSANRINAVLETEESIKQIENTKEFDASKKGLVEFKNVCFRYPDADTEILTDISFTAKPGETTAIIGSTGSGKSTVVNLIPRFYDITGGELLIDGVNIKEADIKKLREIIGFVPQRGLLFSGTIESNIKYSNSNMSDEQMKEAATIAQATDFIEAKEKKYNSEIAQGGTNVSGGQRQRLSIARAIAKDPEIYVFDDSFSALDFKTDLALRTALAEKTKDKTVIIVAQRISTILNADQIIVLEEGELVGKGTHKELIENNETYRQIALSQLSEEELG